MNDGDPVENVRGKRWIRVDDWAYEWLAVRAENSRALGFNPEISATLNHLIDVFMLEQTPDADKSS